MGDNEARASNIETNHSSCPYPITDYHFPMPSTSENLASVPERDRRVTVAIDTVPIGMLSPYFGDQIIDPEDFPLTGVSINRAGTGIVQHNNSPSAPYINRISADEQTQSRPAIGFLNPLTDHAEVTSAEPPPSYDKLFAPKSTAIETGISTDTTSSNHISTPSSSEQVTNRTGRRFYKIITGVTFNGREYVCTTSDNPYQRPTTSDNRHQRPTMSDNPHQRPTTSDNLQRRTRNYSTKDSMGCFAIVVAIIVCLYVPLAIYFRFRYST